MEPERRGASACFTGHRELTMDEEQLSGRLDAVLTVLYALGYRRFFNGAALGFDQLAAERVLELRQRHPDVRLIMAVPCAEQSRRWNEDQSARYERILQRADETRVLARHYYNGCMNVRNRYMVDRSSFCVSFLDQPRGGTVATVAYAISQSVRLLNVADDRQLQEFLQQYQSVI